MEVVITPEDLPEVFIDGSVMVVTGTTEDGTKRVTFVGDARPTGELLRAVQESGEPQIAVTGDFAVTSIRPIRKCATVGCRAPATEVIKYRFRGERATDSVCSTCADSYERRPALNILARHPVIQGS
jgi:hypothetical protein